MKVEYIGINASISIPVNISQFRCNVILQVFAGVDKVGIEYCDIDISDYEGFHYMDMPIDGYENIKKLRLLLNEFGINLDKIIDDEAKKQYSKESIIELLKSRKVI
jgi:hypothetical protein